MIKLIGMLALFGLALPAHATGLAVTVSDQAGRAADHAVVSLKPLAPADLSGWQKPRGEMRQEHTQFVPFVLAAQVGGTVSFPNFDEFRHHVYSFSKPKRFELRLYGQDETKTVTFDQPGVVALGCNIHDNMLAYIYVTEDPVYAVADNAGVARFDGLPAGDYRMQVWHPDLTGAVADGPVVSLGEDGTVTQATQVALKENRRMQLPPAEENY